MHKYQKGIDGGESVPSKGGKSLTELPSSGGMRHKLTAIRRGFLCSKMQNDHFYDIRWVFTVSKSLNLALFQFKIKVFV